MADLPSPTPLPSAAEQDREGNHRLLRAAHRDASTCIRIQGAQQEAQAAHQRQADLRIGWIVTNGIIN